jgi:hypothetical protein
VHASLLSRAVHAPVLPPLRLPEAAPPLSATHFGPSGPLTTWCGGPHHTVWGTLLQRVTHGCISLLTRVLVQVEEDGMLRVGHEGVAEQYKPEELRNGDMATITSSPPWAVDAWGLGCFWQELFSGTPLQDMGQLRNIDSLPKQVRKEGQAHTHVAYTPTAASSGVPLPSVLSSFSVHVERQVRESAPNGSP